MSPCLSLLQKLGERFKSLSFSFWWFCCLVFAFGVVFVAFLFLNWICQFFSCLFAIQTVYQRLLSAFIDFSKNNGKNLFKRPSVCSFHLLLFPKIENICRCFLFLSFRACMNVHLHINVHTDEKECNTFTWAIWHSKIRVVIWCCKWSRITLGTCHKICSFTHTPTKYTSAFYYITIHGIDFHFRLRF